MGESAKHLNPKGYGDDIVCPIFYRVVDGDKSLVVADETIIKVAKRNMKKFDIVPLYYNMKKAEPVQLTKENIYHGLILAFVGGNIGLYSNDISKIWNSGVFQHGTNEEQKEALDIIKILCMENNFVIDYAKTLYKPERPKEVHKKITSFTKNKLPHFFIYAKDKENHQVEPVNDSFVNLLDTHISDPRINLRHVGLQKIDYRLMVSDIDSPIDYRVVDLYKTLNRNYKFKVSQKNEHEQNLHFISKHIKEKMQSYPYTEEEIADMLVKYFYRDHISSVSKDVLWFSYGKYLIKNLREHLGARYVREVQCENCKDWFFGYSNNVKLCPLCRTKHERKLKKESRKKTENIGKKDIQKVRFLRFG